MYDNYRALVLRYYRLLRDSNGLSQRLTIPTAAGIRDECLSLCKGRYLRKDDRTFERFFGKSGEMKIVLEAIEQFDINKFKQLLKLLKGRPIKTDSKNIELLAWLINFEPRPYELGRKYDLDQPNDGKGKKKQGWNDQEEEANRRNIGIRLKKLWEAISGKPEWKLLSIILIASLIIGLTKDVWIDWFVNKKPPEPYLTGQEKCMYWAGDHYQPISCTQKIDGGLVIGFDSIMFHNLKKITRLDTITQISIGKVYYIKMSGTIEFYTDSGFHPEYPQLRLRPMTDYIFRKYILAKQQ